MHSFGMSERFAILAENPLLVTPMKMPLSKKAFIDNYQWEPERGTRFVVIDRHTGELQGIHEADAFFCFHHVNAFERDGELVVDLIAYDDPSVIHMLDLDELRTATTALARSGLRRYRIKLDGSGVAREDIGDDVSPELPRINYRAQQHARLPLDVRTGATTDADWSNQLVKMRRHDRRVADLVRGRLLPGRAAVRRAPGRDRRGRRRDPLSRARLSDRALVPARAGRRNLRGSGAGRSPAPHPLRIPRSILPRNKDS